MVVYPLMFLFPLPICGLQGGSDIYYRFPWICCGPVTEGSTEYCWRNKRMNEQMKEQADDTPTLLFKCDSAVWLEYHASQDWKPHGLTTWTAARHVSSPWNLLKDHPSKILSSFLRRGNSIIVCASAMNFKFYPLRKHEILYQLR